MRGYEIKEHCDRSRRGSSPRSKTANALRTHKTIWSTINACSRHASNLTRSGQDSNRSCNQALN